MPVAFATIVNPVLAGPVAVGTVVNPALSTIHFNTYFCIDYVNRAVSDPPVARQSRIRPSCQKVWPPLASRIETVYFVLLEK